MSTDTELRTLPPDQQHAVAEIELQEFRRRERFLAHARSYTGKRWATFLFLVPAFWVVGKNLDFPYSFAACVLILLTFTLLEVHIQGINRRLDALLMLRDLEIDAADQEQRK